MITTFLVCKRAVSYKGFYCREEVWELRGLKAKRRAIITPKPEDVIEIARAYQIEADVIGTVTREAGIRIASEGYFSCRGFLRF